MRVLLYQADPGVRTDVVLVQNAYHLCIEVSHVAEGDGQGHRRRRPVGAHPAGRDAAPTICWTCALEARPSPVTIALTADGEYSKTSSPARAAASRITPKPGPPGWRWAGRLPSC